MWFKNLQLFRIPVLWPITAAQLDEQLTRGPFLKCTAHQPISVGWVSPRNDGRLLYALGGQWLICLCSEERLLPARVINEVLQERLDAIEDSQGYAPGRKQAREIRERVTDELMPQAFTQKQLTYAWLDPINGWLAINAASANKAETVLNHLRYTLDELPVQRTRTQTSPTSAMADWLSGGDAPTGFTIDRDCELKSASDDKAAVRYSHHALDGDGIEEQIKAHLAAGKLPTKLALTWDDRISFVLTENLEIKRLAFLDLLIEQAAKDAEYAEEQFDADFALMTGELARFLPQLVDALGGETPAETDLVSPVDTATRG